MGGSIQGRRPSSYRAELFGALVLSLLIKHIKSYLHSDKMFKAHIHIDNKSVVDIIHKLQNKQSLEQLIEDPYNEDTALFYKIDHLTLKPEWDLIAKLKPLLEDPAYLNWTFLWIEGHQDRKSTYNDLTLKAQLNCDADQIAGNQQETAQQETPWQVSLTSECLVHLDIKGRTITSKYKSTI